MHVFEQPCRRPAGTRGEISVFQRSCFIMQNSARTMGTKTPTAARAPAVIALPPSCNLARSFVPAHPTVGSCEQNTATQRRPAAAAAAYSRIFATKSATAISPGQRWVGSGEDQLPVCSSATYRGQTPDTEQRPRHTRECGWRAQALTDPPPTPPPPVGCCLLHTL